MALSNIGGSAGLGSGGFSGRQRRKILTVISGGNVRIGQATGFNVE
jgi:hypothetical protein